MIQSIPYNKSCWLEDFADAEISAIIDDAFMHKKKTASLDPFRSGYDAEQWRVAMHIRALRDHHALSDEAVILGVGAGTQVTSYYLTQYVKQVFATDTYQKMGSRAAVAPYAMMISPEEFAPYPYLPDRLVVQYMDPRLLTYPDNWFDGIFCSDSLEFLGSFENVAHACFEMGRVLKPGGVLTLTTLLKINGPSVGDGWDSNVLLFSQERLARWIVEASGLELVDELQTQLTEQTLLTKRNLPAFFKDVGNFRQQAGTVKDAGIVTVHQGYLFCPIHLALKKTAAYPALNNDWAAPTAETRRLIKRQREQAITDRHRSNQHGRSRNAGLNLPGMNRASDRGLAPVNIYTVMHAHNEWQDLRLSPDAASERVRFIRNNKILRFFYRTIMRIRKLGKVWEAERAVHETMIHYLEGMQQNENYLLALLEEQEDRLRAQEEALQEITEQLQAMRDAESIHPEITGKHADWSITRKRNG